MPTSSELVARILALSSVRLTPAMEATSLMSSSSLHGGRREAHLEEELTPAWLLQKNATKRGRFHPGSHLERQPELRCSAGPEQTAEADPLPAQSSNYLRLTEWLQVVKPAISSTRSAWAESSAVINLLPLWGLMASR